MKHILTILILIASLQARAQFAYISTNGNVILYSGSIERFNTPDIFVDGEYNTTLSTWTITLQLTAPGAGAGNYVKAYQIELSKATVDSYTPGTATGETETMQNVILQAVAAYLLALNATITFTLN